MCVREVDLAFDYMPVKDGNQLVGIISIGDVLKHRLGELQVEADVLRVTLWLLGIRPNKSQTEH